MTSPTVPRLLASRRPARDTSVPVWIDRAAARRRPRAPGREPWMSRQSRDRLGIRDLARVIWEDGWPGRAFLATLALAGTALLAAAAAVWFGR